jgi:hypothetical protein
VQGSTISPAPCKTKTEKEMDKKFYVEPQEEVLFLEMNAALLAGSASDGIDDDNGEAGMSEEEY